jgi:putative addiction module killer protein
MNSIVQTEEFKAWLLGVTDLKARAAILVRIARAASGNFGDCSSVGAGVFEMRIDVGAGYRVYYVRRGRTVYLLLCGGSKKTQAKDIARAKALAEAT